LRETLHRHFGDQMKYSGRIGLTHRGTSPDEPLLPGAKPVWFDFAPKLDSWLTVIEGKGPATVKQIYLDTLNGRVPPDQGHILSL
jgi:hypothetical protein